VLSKSVYDAFEYYGDPLTTETQKFVLNFDVFFDCLHGRSISAVKPNRKPYFSPDDSRLSVSMMCVCVCVCVCV
jgi:hypothetical protein